MGSSMWVRVGALAAVATIASCYSAPHDACGITCETTCPDGYTCTNHTCAPKDGHSCVSTIAFSTVGLGSRHACGLDDKGVVWCWGDNSEGQLGVGASVQRSPMPLRATDASTAYTALAVGAEHACALAGGVATCWGLNDDNQVSSDAAMIEYTPVVVGSGGQPPVFDAIAAGDNATCALSAGELWCWGNSQQTATANGAKVPTRVGDKNLWTAVSIGTSHACAISASTGELACWGGNGHNEASPNVGNLSTITTYPLPAGQSPIALHAGSLRTCAVLAATAGAATGALYCWGSNNGAIDPAGPSSYTTPTQLGTDTDWTDIVDGNTYLCGRRGGHAMCWGASDTGGLASGVWSDTRPLASAADLGAVDQLVGPFDATARGSRAGDHVCVRIGTQVSCAGENAHGELADSVAASHPATELAAPGGRTWQSVISGRRHLCALTTDHAAWCWGSDVDGESTAMTGRGGPSTPCTSGSCSEPSIVPAPVATADELVAGDTYSCARAGATISCWGDPSRLGANASTPAVTTVAAPAGAWTKLFGGHTSSCGVTDGGAVYCWGDFAAVPTLAPVIAGTTIDDISFGDGFGCAHTADNSRACFGANDVGQCGVGSTATPQTVPTKLSPGEVAKVVAAGQHTCALFVNQTVLCWGANFTSQSGAPNSSTTIATPVQVMTTTGPLTGCTAIAVGQQISCAICGGQPQCWGRNSYDELGRGNTFGYANAQAAPVVVPVGLTFVAIAAFDDGACALTNQNRLFCWGRGVYGELGDGSRGRPYLAPLGAPP